MYASRWLTLTASILLQCSAGVSYCFSLYSSRLKDALGYDQSQIEGLASPLVALLVVGWLPGFAYDRLSHRHHLGPRVVLLWGLLEHFSGYFCLWLAATGRVVLPYWAMVGLTVMAFNGSNWIDTACIATNVQNFPADRGTVVGVLKALVGLSASMYTSIYAAVFRPDAVSFLLAIAIAPVAMGLCAMPFFNAVPQPSACMDAPKEKTGMRFTLAYNSIIVLAAFQLGASGFVASSEGLAPSMRGGLLAALGLVLLPLLCLWMGSGPLLVHGATSQPDEEVASLPGVWKREAVKEGRGQGPVAPALGGEEGAKAVSELQTPLLPPATQGHARNGETSGKQAEVERVASPNLTIWECAQSLNFWLLFFVFGCGTGVGLMFVNNLGQLVESLGGPADGQDVLVSLFSIFSSAGRLACGFLPEVLLHRYRVPRTAFLVGVSALNAGVCALSAISSLGLLWVAAPAAGFAFGCHWSLMPPLASELFGMRNFASLYCLLQFATTFGTYALATRLAGGVYQQHAAKHQDEGDICYGTDCYRLTFVVGAALELAAMLLAVGLYIRTCWLYKGDSSRSQQALADDKEDAISTAQPLCADCNCQIIVNTEFTDHPSN